MTQHLQVWGLTACNPSAPAPTLNNSLLFVATRIACGRVVSEDICEKCMTVALYCAVNRWARGHLHARHARRFKLYYKNHGHENGTQLIAAFRKQQLEYLLKRVSEG